MSLSNKLKILLFAIENTFLYFAVGMLVAYTLPTTVLPFIFTLMAVAAVIETIMYRNFVWIINGTPTEEELFDKFTSTLLSSFLWFISGYVFVEVIL